MTSRERVRAALEYKPVDRTPKDLGGMRSTGVSCFAHPKLRRCLGLPESLPRVYDENQMLALPERDLLDALGCDVEVVELGGITNSMDDSRWHPYDFAGRLSARVLDPSVYKPQADGTILRVIRDIEFRMPSGSYVFDRLHGGEPLDLSTEPKAPDPAATKKALEKSALKDEDVQALEKELRRVRSESDRAIMLAVHRGGLGFPGGMAAWSMLCLLDPDGVAEHFSLIADATIRDYKTLFSGIAGLADTIMAAADDQGTQQTTILPPSIFRTLYVPAYRRMNDALHRADPTIKSFLHSCGAIYDLLPDVAAAGFDALNPVQWCAGGHSYAEWKTAAAAQKLALWGGGVNTQATLPLGSVLDVEKEAREVAAVLSKGSGWIFCAIHNLLAEIPPEKIVALYRSV